MVAAYGSSCTSPGYAAGTVTSLTLPAPAGVAAGDILVAVLHIEQNPAPTLTVPAGWAVEAQNASATPNAMSGSVIWKRATAADVPASGARPFTYTFSWATTAWATGVTHRFTGAAASGNPFGGSATAMGSTTALPSIPYTASGPGLGIWLATVFVDSLAATPPAGYTTANAQTFGALTLGTRTDAGGAKTSGPGTSTVNDTAFIFAGVLLDASTGRPFAGAVFDTAAFDTGDATGQGARSRGSAAARAGTGLGTTTGAATGSKSAATTSARAGTASGTTNGAGAGDNATGISIARAGVAAGAQNASPAGGRTTGSGSARSGTASAVAAAFGSKAPAAGRARTGAAAGGQGGTGVGTKSVGAARARPGSAIGAQNVSGVGSRAAGSSTARTGSAFAGAVGGGSRAPGFGRVRPGTAAGSQAAAGTGTEAAATAKARPGSAAGTRSETGAGARANTSTTARAGSGAGLAVGRGDNANGISIARPGAAFGGRSGSGTGDSAGALGQARGGSAFAARDGNATGGRTSSSGQARTGRAAGVVTLRRVRRRTLTWHVCDSATGKIVGHLEPNKWEITEPLRQPSTGALTVPIPDNTPAINRLKELVKPRVRSIVMEDEDGRLLFAGPIPRRPARNEGEISVPLVDWRSWFYRTPLRPNRNGTRRNYIKTGPSAREQGLIMTDLMRTALDTVAPPMMVVDTAPTTGVARELTAMMLDRSIGQYLDDVMNRERGCEWYTYPAFTANPTFIFPHVAVAWPERKSREYPVRLEWRVRKGGNTFDYSWPEGSDAATRVWVVGAGEPPAQVFTSDEYPELKAGADITWETTLGPLDGVVKKATAFEHAYAAVERSRGYDGTAEFGILADKLPLGDVTVGDRARVILDDGWDNADVGAARITQRVMSGGKGLATVQRLSIDLADDGYSDNGTDPGVVVQDDGNY